jgi:hypothetical protein
MLDEMMGYISDIWGRLSKLESKNIQAISVIASTTASKNTNINAGTVTISWNNSDYNYGTLFSHSTVTNDSRITINRKCAVEFGVSVIGATAVANTSILVQCRLNGSTTLTPNSYINISAAGGTTESDATFTGIRFGLNAGDYLEVRCISTGAAGDTDLYLTLSNFWVREIYQ